jgi:hypothetical protein
MMRDGAFGEKEELLARLIALSESRPSENGSRGSWA